MIYLLIFSLGIFIGATLLIAIGWKFGALLFLLWNLFFVE